MVKKRKFKIGRLVRDKIPQRLQSLGGEVLTYSLTSDDYSHHLKLKLKEEAEEVLKATTTEALQEELADVLEVFNALLKNYHLSWDDIEQARLQKHQTRGGFEKHLFVDLIEIETEDNSHPIIQYCLADPEKCPEIL